MTALELERDLQQFRDAIVAAALPTFLPLAVVAQKPGLAGGQPTVTVLEDRLRLAVSCAFKTAELAVLQRTAMDAPPTVAAGPGLRVVPPAEPESGDGH